MLCKVSYRPDSPFRDGRRYTKAKAPVAKTTGVTKAKATGGKDHRRYLM
jgi:hypothetical protein